MASRWTTVYRCRDPAGSLREEKFSAAILATASSGMLGGASSEKRRISEGTKYAHREPSRSTMQPSRSIASTSVPLSEDWAGLMTYSERWRSFRKHSGTMYLDSRGRSPWAVSAVTWVPGVEPESWRVPKRSQVSISFHSLKSSKPGADTVFTGEDHDGKPCSR